MRTGGPAILSTVTLRCVCVRVVFGLNQLVIHRLTSPVFWGGGVFVLIWNVRMAENKKIKERTGGRATWTVFLLFDAAGAAAAAAAVVCGSDVRRIIHQSRRGTIAWLSLTYQWPGAARSFASAPLNHPFTLVQVLGSIHPSETVSSSSIESITFRTRSLSLSLFFSVCTLYFFDRFFYHFIYILYFFSPLFFFLFIILSLYTVSFSFSVRLLDAADELDESSSIQVVVCIWKRRK